MKKTKTELPYLRPQLDVFESDAEEIFVPDAVVSEMNLYDTQSQEFRNAVRSTNGY